MHIRSLLLLAPEPQPHRSKSVVALMVKQTPMAVEPYLGADKVRQLRDTYQYLPALAPESAEAQMIAHIHNGEEQQALDLLEQGAYPRAEDEVGLSLLHHAAAAGMLLLTNRLMDKGAYADAVSIMDESVLTYVILSNAEGPKYTPDKPPERGNGKNNILAVIDQLIKRHPDLEQPDSNGDTAALHAATIGDIDVMARLKQAGANLKHRNHDEQSVTFLSAYAGHYMMNEQLLHWGIDPRPEPIYVQIGRSIAAGMKGRNSETSWRYDRCEKLLARGEVMAEAREIAKMPIIGADLTRVIDNPNAYRQVHENALKKSDHVIAQVSLAIVSEMCGFEVSDPNSFEIFMLGKAVHNEHDFLLATLERGADAKATDPYGRTGIILQAMRGFHTGMAPLKQFGCNVNAQDALLESALHCAAMTQSREGVRSLLKLGANPLLKNWKELTPRQQMIMQYQTPASDKFNEQAGGGEGVITSAEDLESIIASAQKEGAQKGFVAVIPKSTQESGADPVILAMLQMAENRWLRGEANYQAAQRRSSKASLN